MAAWVQARAPHAENGFGPHFVAVGVEDGGELIAGWVFNEYRKRQGWASIHASMASTSPRWCSRRTLNALFSYPFVQLGCVRMTAYTGKNMVSVRQFLERLGFVEEGIARRGFADDDCVIYGMLKDECRWI